MSSLLDTECCKTLYPTTPEIMPDGVICEPIPWDDDCQSNVTTSICDSEAIDEFRYFFTKTPPVATFMGSDGIDDSYASSQELHDLYSSILTIFAEHGIDIGRKEVSEFLPVLSQKGSGDDVSVAGILSMPLSATFINLIKAQCEYLPLYPDKVFRNMYASGLLHGTSPY